jgi:hypothetical protein
MKSNGKTSSCSRIYTPEKCWPNFSDILRHVDKFIGGGAVVNLDEIHTGTLELIGFR